MVRWLTALAWLAIACTPSRSQQFACEVTEDCEAGRVCDRGFCVASGAPNDTRIVDALDAPPDARLCVGGDARATDGTACFVAFLQGKNRNDAEAACVALDMHLAMILSQSNNSAVASVIGNRPAWIGATDVVSEATFVWPDGSALSFTNFRNGEPNNGGGGGQEDCLVIEGDVNDQWDDRGCGMQFVYVCSFQ